MVDLDEAKACLERAGFKSEVESATEIQIFAAYEHIQKARQILEGNNVPTWVRLKHPVEIQGRSRYYARLRSRGINSWALEFVLPNTKGRNIHLYHVQRSDIERELPYQSDKHGPTVDGSISCESGSLASGGDHSYCTCDTCY